MNSSNSKGQERGSALVITLLFAFLISIVLIAFLSGSRIEMMASESHLNGINAKNYAQTAIDLVVAQITASATTDNQLWATQAGQIEYAKSSYDPSKLRLTLLHSGSAVDSVTPDESVDLNPPGFGSLSRNLIASTGESMRVRWIYLLQNGSFTTEVPPYNKVNPAIGRLAFWTDDESAKINLNTAWTRNSINGLSSSHPSRISLDVLPELSNSDSNIINNFRTSAKGHFFNDLSDLRGVPFSNKAMSEVENKHFNFTTYNQSPEMNVFNEPRIVLTTQKNLAGNAPFLDILMTPNTDPGDLTRLDTTKIEAVVNQLSDILRRKDWPQKRGVSFEDKYAQTGSPSNPTPVRIEQIALNIVEYVRCRESAMPIVDPIRGYINNNRFKYANGGLDTIMGNTRAPRITEVGAVITQVGAIYQCKFKFEVVSPREFNLPSLTLTDLGLFLSALVNNTASNVTGGATGDVRINLSEITDGGGLLLNPGTRRVLTRARTTAINPTFFQIRIGLTRWPWGPPQPFAPRFDFSPIGTGAGLRISPLNVQNGLAENMITSISVADPCSNDNRLDWAQGLNTFFPNPESPATFTSDVTPAQDAADGAGTVVSTTGVHFPAPKGQRSATGLSIDDNDGEFAGIMKSVAELGFIHTGEESLIGRSIPFRTFRLQPQPLSERGVSLPDWVLLDVFTVPIKKTSDPALNVFLQRNSSDLCRGGLININSAIPPFGDSSTNSSIERLLPLQALLHGASKKGSELVSLTSEKTLAFNIANKVPSLAGAFDEISSGMPFLFLSRGQLAEVKGIADDGEESEECLRSIVDLVTTRSNVFSVYSIGQAIHQDSTGRIRVLAERRYHSVLERSVPEGETEAVINIIYSRDLNF